MKAITNKFRGVCRDCSANVAPGTGIAFREGSRWVVLCAEHKGETHGATNPWKADHHAKERGHIGGEYTWAKARKRVDHEYENTDDLAEPCPKEGCGGTCHWRATVGARQCPDCRTMIVYRWDEATGTAIRKVVS